MARKRILWLCSWYPSKTEPFNGDFIQRHARAAALYNDIYVIHVTGDTSGRIKNTEKQVEKFPGLTEHIVYFKKSASFTGKVRAYYQWLFLFKQAIRKYIVENGKPDMVHVHVPMRAGLLGIWLKKKYKLDYILSEHWGIYNDIEMLNYTGRSTTFKRLTKKIINNAATFISVSKYLGEGINKLVIKKEYEIIPNVVDTGLFFYNEHENAVFRFIHVSNMVPLKNAEGILRAFKMLVQRKENAQLVMVGDTDPAIRKYAEETGLMGNHLSFMGEVPYAEVAKEMQRSDCFVLFSNIENSPCVIGEALCCGLSVITTAVGGVPELADETNSLLVEAGNDAQLSAAMSNMITSFTKYKRKKIAENARSKFSYEVVGKIFDELYGRF